MADKKAAASATTLDDEYKEATKAVVDDRLRTDVLGPRFCAVLKEHSPTQDAIAQLIETTILQNPGAKKAVNVVISDYNNSSKVKYLNIGIGAVGTIFMALIIWFLQRTIGG